MSEKINLESIKKHIYLYYTEDGLVDLAIGLMIFGFGFLLMIDLPALVGILGLLPFLIWYLGKQALVVPRVGSIQQSQTMRNRFKGFFVNLLIIGICVFVLFLLSNRSGSDSLSNYS